MNTIAILDNLIEKKPESTKDKYIFIVGNNEALYKSIMAAHYIAIPILANELTAYLDMKIHIGLHIREYVWVPCLSRKDNEALFTFFENEGVPYSKQEWRFRRLGENPSDEAMKQAIETITEEATSDSSNVELPTYYTRKPHNTSQYIDDLLISDIERLKAAGCRQTGFPVLDKLCKGLYAGLYTIAATSSLGKTTFALQIADNLAEAGHEVLFFSLEQSRLELITKSFSRMLKQANDETISSLTLRSGSDSENLKAAAQLYKAKIDDRMNIIEGNFGCSVDYVTAYVAEYISKNGGNPIVFVDYLQILQPSAAQKNMSTREAIDQTVTALKRLSRDYGLTIFIISSVNRANYMQPIDFESLKESGGIEYTCDVIWGLQLQCLNEEIFSKGDKIKEKRERIKAAKAENPRQIELVCLKNRYGISNFTCSFEYRPDCDLYTQELEGNFNPSYDGAFQQRRCKRLERL